MQNLPHPKIFKSHDPSSPVGSCSSTRLEVAWWSAENLALTFRVTQLVPLDTQSLVPLDTQGLDRASFCIRIHHALLLNSPTKREWLPHTNLETGAKVLPGPGSPPDVTGGEAPRLTKTDSS